MLSKKKIEIFSILKLRIFQNFLKYCFLKKHINWEYIFRPLLFLHDKLSHPSKTKTSYQ